MKRNHFFIIYSVVALMVACSGVFAKDAANNAGLTEAQKFYGTELKSSKKVVHPPFGWGDCTVCHTDAKGEGALVMNPPELCAMCHEPKDGKKFIHGPVAAGACTTCHNPHESDNVKLLVTSSINELCVSCHQDKDKFLRKTLYIHPSVKDQCTNCHDPHTENHLFQLKADGKKDLCVMCHVDKEVCTSTLSDKHGAFDKDKKCLDCHNPHGSNNLKMLYKPFPRTF